MRNFFLQNKCLPLVAAVFCVLACQGCNEESAATPHDYDLREPRHNELGKVLNEISGLSSGNNNTLLAVADSKEKVFLIDLRTKKLRDLTGKVLAANSDPEDVVQVDSSIYIMLSKGVIKEVREGQQDTTGAKTYDLGLPGTNDFETLYYDPTAKGLVALCKSCAHEKGEGIRTAYRFDLQTKKFDSTAFYTIDKNEVRRILKNNDAKFDPSAAAIHPLNKRLYILSSAGNLLVVTDTRGKVIEAYSLNPDLFPQAEGLAFAPNGDLYIANEGKYGKPNLLMFPYEPNGKKK